jgi:hypothetical protein
MFVKTSLLFVLFLLSIFSLESHGSPTVALREDFNELAAWKPLVFPKIERHTRYSLIPDSTATSKGNVLKAESNASASGLIHQRVFDVRTHPIVRWRWKVQNIYTKADGTTKAGDDYPIRIYVVFKYDPASAKTWERAKYAAAKLVYGEYPPESSLNYVWASTEGSKKSFPNPYTEKARMIVLRSGKSQVGTWQEERVNVLEDYRKAFGKEPPSEASIAIMNDADNTGESSISYIDFIEVRRND